VKESVETASLVQESGRKAKVGEQVRDWLQEYGARIAALEEMTLPLRAEEGHFPLLICSSENIEEMMEAAADGEASIEAYVREQTSAAETRSARQVLRDLADGALAALGEEIGERDDESDLNASYQAYISQWEEGIAMFDENMGAEEGEGSVVEAAARPDSAWIERHEEGELLLLELPAADAWKAPLIVPMGGYNDCPQPLEQAVLFRDWQRRFGAVPAAVTQDTWLLRVGHRPQTHEEALNLAKEHFIFCQYVLESFETIGQYAEHLQHADTWEFWWD